MRTIKIKFDVGDNVYPIDIDEKFDKDKCPACNGMGNIIRCDKTVQPCTHCKGTGEVRTNKRIFWRVGSMQKIDSILVEMISTSNRTVSYIFGRKSRADEGECFGTREEAEAECKKRNERITSDID